MAIQVSASGLSGTATNPLDVTPPPPPPPPAGSPAPTVILEKVAFTQKHNKKGKAVGKPVFAGFTLEYSGPMNAATAGAASSYDVLSDRRQEGQEEVRHELQAGELHGFVHARDRRRSRST